MQFESYPCPFRTGLRFNVWFDVVTSNLTLNFTTETDKDSFQTAHKVQRQLDFEVSVLVFAHS